MREFPHSHFDRRVSVLPDGDSIESWVGEPTPMPIANWRFMVLAQIENFAALRRHLGRPRADLLIGDVAARIEATLPEARIAIAGRDMVEVAFESDMRLSLEIALNALSEAFAIAFDIDGERHLVRLVTGAAIAADHRDDVHLIEEAEHALEEGRKRRITIARDVDEGKSATDRPALARDLSSAIRKEELFLQYQPKVHLRRQEIASVEALVRWQHPVHGLVLPNDFIPLAEESHDIVALTLWTIRRAIADQARLAERGHDLAIFINIAGVLLGDAAFVRQACGLVRTSGARLGFEITETSVIRDPESAIANLKVFADIGIIIAIDDYGAGLSSLAYLKQLPARELKIDKLFVTQLTSSNRDPLIVRSTIDLAHALDMEVVAEGVESPAAMALLSVMGCDMIQGFLISRPVSFDALVHFLEDNATSIQAADMRMPFKGLSTVWKRG